MLCARVSAIASCLFCVHRLRCQIKLGLPLLRVMQVNGGLDHLEPQGDVFSSVADVFVAKVVVLLASFN